MTKSNAFRIVHLSDLHLTAKDTDSRSEPRLFGRLRGMNANWRRVMEQPEVKRADLLLVTGDVTDRGEQAAWKVFWDAVGQADIKRTLVVPGNHEVCCLGLRIPNLGAAAYGYQNEDLEKARAGLAMGHNPTRFPWVERVDDRIAVIGLNSNNLGNLTSVSNAMGQIGFFQLVSLADKLHVIRDVPVKIIALHHSPNIPAPQVEAKRGLVPLSKLERWGHQISQPQEMALQLLAITHRVRLVLHGHLHR
jgi:3',5'-cyclic AMP phosphodiesterase CpdA